MIVLMPIHMLRHSRLFEFLGSTFLLFVCIMSVTLLWLVLFGAISDHLHLYLRMKSFVVAAPPQ